MGHTTQFLQGMFAAYMGCDVTTKYDEDGRTYKTVGISFDEGNLQVETSKGDTDWWNIPICKPILTPLSEITDIDAVEVGKLYYSNKDSHTIEMGRILIDHITTPHMARKVAWSIFDASAIIDYLRSKHYDCGYMHIPSLITAKLAIKKTI